MRCEHPGCRAYAMRGSTLCRAHRPDLPRTGGAPRGNQNARKHGLYSRFFRSEELELLEALGAEGSLTGEIAALRVVLSRVLGETDDPAAATMVFARGVDALVRALRAQRVLEGQRSNALLDALETVLEELGVGE